jgi:lipoprotein-releasing system ATP-binding protein
MSNRDTGGGTVSRGATDRAVILEGVGKTYINGPEKLHILKDIGFEISKGETIIITGESGSGKSTLLNLIGGLDYPTFGRIILGDMRIDTASEQELTGYRNRHVGFIFQFHYLLKDFTAEENVMLPAFMAGEQKKRATERARRLLEDVRLSDRMQHFPSQLSGGERQRVAVARALINSPSIILADEPTGNLDERNSAVIEDMLFSLAKRFDTSMVVVSHDTSMTSRGDSHYHLTGGMLERR